MRQPAPRSCRGGVAVGRGGGSILSHTEDILTQRNRGNRGSGPWLHRGKRRKQRGHCRELSPSHCREFSLSNSRRCEAPNVRAMRLALACHGNYKLNSLQFLCMKFPPPPFGRTGWVPLCTSVPSVWEYPLCETILQPPPLTAIPEQARLPVAFPLEGRGAASV